MTGAPKSSGRRPRSRGRRRAAVLAGLIAAAVTASACAGNGGRPAASGGLQPLVVGIPAPAVTVFSANYAVGQYLGCYKRYGYQFSTQVTTNPAQLVAAFHRNSVDVGVPGSDQYLNMLGTIKTSGGGLPLQAFYELDYPFKYGLAVKPGSPITSFEQLQGKTVGVDVLSDSSAATLRGLLSANNIDPGSVNIIASGVGAASGQALDSGRIDALFYYDVGYGTILQAGIKLRFVTIDGKAPYLGVSGILAVGNSDDMARNKAKYQAFARCTTEGDIFVTENPAAAAYIMLKMFPALGKAGKSLDQQVTDLTLPLMLRQKLLKNPDSTAATPYGLIGPDEFTKDLQILLKTDPSSVDTSTIYTNDLVPKLTDAEVAAVKKSADDFVLSGVSGKIVTPPVPPDAP